MFRAAKEIGEFGKRRRAALDRVDPAARITMIGNALVATGGANGRWAATHSDRMRWLAEQGVTPDEAIRRHHEWSAAAFSDPFFEPATTRRR